MEPHSPLIWTSEDEWLNPVILPIDQLCDKLLCDSPRYVMKWEGEENYHTHVYQYCLYHEFYMNWIGYSTNVNH